jgi:DNA-binding phage protein
MAETKNTAKSKLRLRQIHYNTATWLSACFERRTEWLSPFRGELRRLSFRLTKLAKQAGINREGLTTSDVYLESIRALVKATGTDANPHAEEIQQTTERIMERGREERNSQSGTQTASDNPPTREARMSDDNTTLARFGINPGDVLTVAPVTDPRRGELVLMWANVRCQWRGYGCFISMDAENVTIDEYNGEYDYKPRAFTIYRVVSLSRMIERPAVDAEMPAKSDGLSLETKRRIEELTRRMERLYEPENEAVRFKVEREIYDLTHARVETEEWSEFVSG